MGQNTGGFTLRQIEAKTGVDYSTRTKHNARNLLLTNRASIKGTYDFFSNALLKLVFFTLIAVIGYYASVGSFLAGQQQYTTAQASMLPMPQKSQLLQVDTLELTMGQTVSTSSSKVTQSNIKETKQKKVITSESKAKKENTDSKKSQKNIAVGSGETVYYLSAVMSNSLTVEMKEYYMIVINDYIAKFAPVAISEMNKYKIPASITIAQGLLESNVGTSRLVKKGKNHFGMKCFSKKCKKGHCGNFTDDSHKDFFRFYGSDWGSFRGHSLLLKNKRYKPLFKLDITDYKGWAKGLKKCGYATDRNYHKKLIKIIEGLKLYEYDK